MERGDAVSGAADVSTRGAALAGATVGAAGSATGTAGATGAAGATAGTGGTTGTAGAVGAGGGAAMSCGALTPLAGDAKCCVAAGTAADLAIDDLEDKDNVILPAGQRQGYWYTYGSAGATQTPPPGKTFVPNAGGYPCSLLPLTIACKAMNTAPMGTAGTVLFSAETKGSLPPATAALPSYAGLGFDFNNHFAKSCVYGASAYHGISFWAKGTVPFQAGIAVPATTPTTSDSGTCATMCSDNFSMTVAPPPDGTTWKQFTITFADMTTFAQAGWGTPATFDPSKIINMQFQVNATTTATAAAPFDISIDDVAFVP